MKLLFNIKATVCTTPGQLKCAQNIRPDLTKCMLHCDGVLVTSHIKTENFNKPEDVAPTLMQQYNAYKKFVPFPENLKGLYIVLIVHFLIL